VLARERFFVAPDAQGVRRCSWPGAWIFPAPDDGVLPPEHQVMLVDPCEPCHVPVLRSGRTGQPARWLDRWSGRDRLPEWSGCTSSTMALPTSPGRI